MNAKQTVPIIATLAPIIGPLIPPLVVIGGLVLVAKWLFSDEESEKKAETPPPTGIPRNAADIPTIPHVSSGKSVQNRLIPPYSAEKLAALPVPSPIPANSDGKPNLMAAPPASATVPTSSIPPAPKIPVPPPSVIPAVKVQPLISSPAQKKSITRADMANIFNSGSRGLTRKSTVAALKTLGFSKTAAYEALAINGRFKSWLQFAPDGIITWKN